MESKKFSNPGFVNILKNSLFGLLGILVLSQLADVLFGAVSLSYLLVANASTLPGIDILIRTYSWLVALAGFVIGYTSMAKKNAFYAQSGGVTAVINASACGVIETARKHKDKIGK